jgi:hypothetical protein
LSQYGEVVDSSDDRFGGPIDCLITRREDQVCNGSFERDER